MFSSGGTWLNSNELNNSLHGTQKRKLTVYFEEDLWSLRDTVSLTTDCWEVKHEKAERHWPEHC